MEDDELIAITRNRGENRIIWLERGTSTREFIHIILRHAEEFEEFFGISEDRDIAKFIFQAISKNQIYNSYDGYYPGSKVYVYRFGANYLHVLVGDQGSIITTYPSYYSN